MIMKLGSTTLVPAPAQQAQPISTDFSNEQFYVSRINWLVGEGRDDLIDAIADEYEPTQPPSTGSLRMS